MKYIEKSIDNKIETLLEAVDEVGLLKDVELEKISVLLQQLMELIEQYGKSQPMFFAVADGLFIRTLTDIAFDYVCEVKGKMEGISEFLNNEFDKQKQVKMNRFEQEAA